ncbi:MAG: hypothetical protein ACRDP1_06175 [Nocardioidaceae bacterium]
MGTAALVTWLVTAVGGFYLLGTWIAKGGTREPRTTRFPAPVIFGHFALAAVGLLVWIGYVIDGSHALAWAAFVILVPVALLGFTMLARWLPARRASSVVSGVPAAPGATTGMTGTAQPPAESSFPLAVVVGHGLLAVVTVVLVLLTALQLGGG